MRLRRFLIILFWILTGKLLLFQTVLQNCSSLSILYICHASLPFEANTLCYPKFVAYIVPPNTFFHISTPFCEDSPFASQNSPTIFFVLLKTGRCPKAVFLFLYFIFMLVLFMFCFKYKTPDASNTT